MHLRTYFTWSILIAKHLLKMPIIPVMLMLIPAFTFILTALPDAAADSGVTVGLYFEVEDDITLSMKEQLCSLDEAFSFVAYNDSQSMTEDVILGRIECGYIFDAGFSAAVRKDSSRNAIKVIVSPATVLRSAADELVFSCLLKLQGYEIIREYAHIDSIPKEQQQEAENYLTEAYEAYCESGETFHLDIVTTSGSSINDEDDSGLGVTFPLRGVLSILTFLAGMLGCAAWQKEKEQGLFAPRSMSFLILSRILYPFIPAALFLISSEFALHISGSAMSPLSELVLAIQYLTIITAFAILCSLILRSSSLIISFIPILVIGSLIFCPVFVNVESFIPALRFVSRLFPPRYFL